MYEHIITWIWFGFYSWIYYEFDYRRIKMLSVNEINLLQAQNEGLKKQNKELQQENTELKAENERLKRELSGKRFICPQCMEFAKEIHKYKQTLQEIKEICKNSHTSASEDYYRTAEKIQAKINEVIGAEE